MARIRTIPEAQASITIDRIEQFGVRLIYRPDESLDKNNTSFVYTVGHYDENNIRVGEDRRSIPFTDWPAAVKTDLRAIYDRILVDAEAQSLIGMGTDTDDLA